MFGPRSAPFVRALLVLGRARASADLLARARGGALWIQVRQGSIEAITRAGAESPGLGVSLLREGVALRAMRDVVAEGAGQKIGDAMVTARVASEAAVTRALRRQWVERLADAIAGGAALVEMRTRAGDVAPYFGAQPLGPLLLRALRASGAAKTEAPLARAYGGSDVALGALGEALVEEGALYPDEEVLVGRLRGGARLAALGPLLHTSSRARNLLGILHVTGGLCAVATPPDACTWLLCASRGAGRADPLDSLSRAAGTSSARATLRHVAARIHPDRFHAGPDALRRRANEVLGVLVDLEQAARRADHS